MRFKPFILPLLLAFCTLFYYFGELVDWAAWDALRSSFFYSVHDIHRLLFLAPIIYAGYTARVRGAVIITLVSFLIFLPRAFFISPYPDPLVRMILFVVFAGVIGTLVGTIRNQSVHAQRMESLVTGERDKLLKILDGIADGVVITDRQYKIRYLNSKMVQAFGDGVGATCHQYLRQSEEPCPPPCRIPRVIDSGEIEKWECRLSNGRYYEVVAAPYVDTGGEVYQVSVFRDVTSRGA